MNTNKRQMLVTTALPYANGSIHIGHLVEHIQSDIWVRFQRHRGHQCIFICGDDAHGTPIMISAEKQGISPEELIKAVHKEHLEDFQNFQIEYDNFYTTHSEENIKLSQLIYTRLRDRGDIETRAIMQCFDTEKNMFLPDRYVKGECPRCGAKDQYGDNCEECGATYTPSDLKNPTSILSGTTPTEKESVHYFFKLENYHDMLHEWLQSGDLQQSVAKKLLEWFQDGLQQWDISRDAPYFGIEIPDAPGKYFYVWLDAPVGYMASFENLCKQRDDLKFDDYWSVNSDKELYHFIGKDIIYFHALFWPAMLEGSGFRKPTNIFAHGFLTVDGKKMSKSRGTFITAKKYIDHLDPELLRYYYAAKLNSHIDDIDFNLEDFVNRVNSDLIGKLINIASRCAGFITKKHDGMLAKNIENEKLYQTFIDKSEQIAELFETRNYNQAIREIMSLADVANQYIAEKEPWTLAKDESKLAEVQNICTMGINFFRALVTFLKPVTPTLAKKTEKFLNVEPLVWNDINQPLLDHKIEKFKPMMQRIDKDTVEKLTE